jgi:light-regulated signal transduction histidine kinase (bacteriophytochrome)
VARRVNGGDQVLGSGAELSERGRAEEELRDENDRLQALLTLRTVERDRAREALESFVYVASHDLGEPVRKVVGFGGLLRKRYGDLLTGPAGRYLGFMIDAAERLGAQLDALLEWSRVETRGQPLKPVDLGAIARAVLVGLRTQVEERGAVVDLGDLPEVEGDVAQLRALLGHLLVNALTFHDPAAPPTVRVCAEVQGDRVRLQVSDDGIGFEQRDAERILQPFVRLNARHEYRGTGMGLAICARIAARHGGAISARAAPGEGATFEVELPIRGRTGVEP